MFYLVRRAAVFGFRNVSSIIAQSENEGELRKPFREKRGRPIYELVSFNPLRREVIRK
jgi:hypothetical protein